MKILKALRRAINRNADSCKKVLETINYEKPRKIRKLICWDESWAKGSEWISRRKDKWSGRQNNGNYTIKTADRKPNEEKRKVT